MSEKEIDYWDREELIAIRHIGTLCAGAIALLAIVPENLDLGGLYLRFTVGLLLIGVAGSGIYQLGTIHAKALRQTPMRMVGAYMVVSGPIGFLMLGLGVLYGGI
jgi:hypothetical protein